MNGWPCGLHLLLALAADSDPWMASRDTPKSPAGFCRLRSVVASSICRMASMPCVLRVPAALRAVNPAPSPSVALAIPTPSHFRGAELDGTRRRGSADGPLGPARAKPPEWTAYWLWRHSEAAGKHGQDGFGARRTTEVIGRAHRPADLTKCAAQPLKGLRAGMGVVLVPTTMPRGMRRLGLKRPGHWIDRSHVDQCIIPPI